MVISGVLIHTLPGRAPAVAERLAGVPGLAVHGDDGDGRVAAVWCAASGDELESRGEALVASDADVLGVFPTFAAEDGTGEEVV